MDIYKDKIPRGSSFPLQTKDFVALEEKVGEGFRSLHYTNHVSDYGYEKNLLCSISYSIPYRETSPSFSASISMMRSGIRAKVRTELLAKFLPKAATWMELILALDEKSTLTKKYHRLSVYWDPDKEVLRMWDNTNLVVKA